MTIASAGVSGHFSHFAGSYRQEFGELPRQTALAARG